MSDFKDIELILTDKRLVGGALAGQGDTHPAGDDDEQIVHLPETINRRYCWEIRNKSNHSETYKYRDLFQFANEVRGRKIEVNGIDRIISPQGYPRSEDHSFDINPKEGTTGDISNYEARLIKESRGDFDEIQPPISRRNMTIADIPNYVDPTGQ